jgi:hypothetical protein
VSLCLGRDPLASPQLPTGHSPHFVFSLEHHATIGYSAPFFLLILTDVFTASPPVLDIPLGRHEPHATNGANARDGGTLRLPTSCVRGTAARQLRRRRQSADIPVTNRVCHCLEYCPCSHRAHPPSLIPQDGDLSYFDTANFGTPPQALNVVSGSAMLTSASLFHNAAIANPPLRGLTLPSPRRTQPTRLRRRPPSNTPRVPSPESSPLKKSISEHSQSRIRLPVSVRCSSCTVFGESETTHSSPQ